MASDQIRIDEKLVALVIRPRSVRRCHEQRECGGSSNAATGTLTVKGPEDAAEQIQPPEQEGA